jgi:hypothetical protein
LLALLLLYSFLSRALPATDCVAKKNSSGDVQVTIGPRQFHVVGWTHLSQKEVDVLRDGFNSAVEALNNNQCDKVKAVLEDATKKRLLDIAEARTVFQKLEAFHSKKPLSFVGVESTPQEMSENMVAKRSINDGLNAMQSRCGHAIAPQATSFLLTMPGPEYAFNEAFQGVIVMKALEDSEAKNEAQRAIASGSNTKNSSAHREAAIVKNALAQDGNGALVVGRAHLTGVVTELLKQCRAL